MFRRLWCVLPFFLIGCKDSPPGPPHVSSIQLVVEDASCTEAWLKVTLTDSNQPRTVALKRDGQTVLTAQLTASDSILIDEGLLPNHSYTYQAVRMRDSVGIDASANTQVTTLDTTSHNWTFSIDTLGDASSELYDVAIVNDTLAYAVGELYLRDSTGQIDPQAWNAAKWDGQQWELKRIPFVGSCSAVLYPPLKAIWAFSATNILVTNGGSIVRYDGTNATMDCGMNQLLLGAINKIYAPSPQDVYAVGNAGTIVYYANGTWQRIESGTSVDLVDVWGDPTGGVVWACGYSNDYSRSILLQCVDQQWRTVVEVPITAPPRADSISGSIASVWAATPTNSQVATSGGMYRTEVRSSGAAHRTWYPSPVSTGFFHRVRGIEKNNVFVVGAFGTIAHFNGFSWHQFEQFFDFSTGPRLLSIAMGQDQMIAVGTWGGKAVVFTGTQQ